MAGQAVCSFFQRGWFHRLSPPKDVPCREEPEKLPWKLPEGSRRRELLARGEEVGLFQGAESPGRVAGREEALIPF